MMPKALAIIVQAAMKPTADLVAVALGHAEPGSETYVVPLAPAGATEATHYGCHTRADEWFIEIITACMSGFGLPPANWGAVGLTEADVTVMCAGLLVRQAPIDEYSTNFDAALAANGLERVSVDGAPST